MKTSPLILIGFMLIANPSQAKFMKSDKLLVYFSDNPTVNILYYKMLKLKFPDLNIVQIKDQDHFNEYIPKDLYLASTNEYGNQLLLKYNLPNSAKTYFNDTSNSSKTDTISYYFFDIGSEKQSGSYYMRVGDNLNSQSVHYEYLDHALQLIHYDGSHFVKSELEEISIKGNLHKLPVIPISSMDKASDWINPVLVPLYLFKYMNPTLLQVDETNVDPCKLSKADTIFLSSILNRDNISRQLLPEPKEEFFKSRLGYFKHRHIKLNNVDFAQEAIKHLEAGEHFYFVYYIGGIDEHFYVIDASDFSIAYYRHKKLSVIFIDVPFRKHIKKFSKFSKKCKSN